MNQALAKSYPDNLTSYDFLKSLAVITMIIDHIGYYFFPEQIEWRIIGRTSLPIWLFLIGYARSREISSLMWLGAGALIISDLVVGMPILALNIIITIILVRLVLDGTIEFALMGRQNMFLIIMALGITVLPTVFLFDYGTQALLFAMFGYMVRHQSRLRFSNEMIILFMGVAFTIYVSYQKLIMGMDTTEAFTMGAGVFLICLMLTQFRSKEYPEITKKMPTVLTSPIKIMGRYTLEIYVMHLLLFKAIGLLYFPERFQLFNWSLF